MTSAPSDPIKAIILAAGLGERLRPLTRTRAKPAIEFLNAPMLRFPYFWLRTLGLIDLVYNTHHLPETVRHAALHVAPPELALHFTAEPIILGTGGGISNARVYLTGSKTFGVANGDGVVIHPDDQVLRRLRQRHESRGALATLLVCPREGVGTRLPGVWMKDDGTVAGFGKSPPRSGLECLHYASFMLLDERVWAHLPDGTSNILYDILVPRIAAGDLVLAYRAEELRWFETGNIAEYLAATQFCLEALARPGDCYGANLRQILGVPAPVGADLRWVDPLARVAPSASLQGFCVIGPDAEVGANAHLENCVVLPGARVAAGQSFRNDVIISS